MEDLPGARRVCFVQGVWEGWGCSLQSGAAGWVSASTSISRVWLSAGPKSTAEPSEPRRRLGPFLCFGVLPDGAGISPGQPCSSRSPGRLRTRLIYFGTASVSVAQSSVCRVLHWGAGSLLHPLTPVQGWGSACVHVCWAIFKVAPSNSALRIPRLTAGSVIFKLPSAMSRCKDEGTGGQGCWGETAPQLFNTMPLRAAVAGAPAWLLTRLQQQPSVPLSTLGAGSGSGHFKSK